MPLDNKAIVRRLYDEVWNKRRLEVLDELISSSHALNDPIVSGSQMGPEFYKRRVVELTTSFPDLRLTIEDMITEKGKVCVSWIISGTHQGEFMDILPLAARCPWRESRFTTSRTGRFLIRTLDGTLWACCDNSVTFLLLD
jgi:predicted ester cyclase